MFDRRRCGRRSALVAGRSSAVVLAGPRGTYYWRDGSGDKATTGRRSGHPATGSGKDLSNLSPTPAIEEGKSEVRRNSTTTGALLGSVAKWTGDQKGNSRFVHARTNHVQRKNHTGRATWAPISPAFTVHRACLSPPTRERGFRHTNQS
jgi:hypothetical protein